MMAETDWIDLAAVEDGMLDSWLLSKVSLVAKPSNRLKICINSRHIL